MAVLRFCDPRLAVVKRRQNRKTGKSAHPPIIQTGVFSDRVFPEPAAFVGAGSVNTRIISTPRLGQLVEAGFLQVVRSHSDPKLDVGLKGQEPRLGQRWNF